ncbi:hypothetical protein FIBSPDRAFT_414405 [Athelia psychrophila]|uniref:Uncharacterized protein n=1 Tax=Athelia psychrophila TaxID=1759441 RepID=A0A167UUU5_9AGAM|nr:hypothetical protein FIBSPDRAFT_414405 [Fibularhizoctonia sp. CBS 109695]
MKMVLGTYSLLQLADLRLAPPRHPNQFGLCTDRTDRDGGQRHADILILILMDRLSLSGILLLQRWHLKQHLLPITLAGTVFVRLASQIREGQRPFRGRKRAHGAIAGNRWERRLEVREGPERCTVLLFVVFAVRRERDRDPARLVERGGRESHGADTTGAGRNWPCQAGVQDQGSGVEHGCYGRVGHSGANFKSSGLSIYMYIGPRIVVSWPRCGFIAMAKRTQ